MILSGGNYGGYTIEGTNAVLYQETDVVDEVAATIGDDININGWLYNLDGIFVGIAV
jgi:hypothetical protein